MRLARDRGFTVLEVLIYAVLSLVLLGGVTIYVQSGLKLFRGGDAYKEAQKDAMLTMRKVSGEITNSTFATDAGGGRIVCSPTANTSIIFPSADDLSTADNHSIWVYDEATGDLMWRKWVMFAVNPTDKTLLKSEFSFDDNTNRTNIPIPPTPGDFPQTTEQFGRNMKSLQVDWLEVGRVAEIALTTETPPMTGTHKGTRIELRTSVRIEN
jgi:hypothetical protein